jgi:hypothetical protein
MIFKCFPSLSSNASSWTETVLEIALPEPNGYDVNKTIYYQPAKLELLVTGSNGIYVEFLTSAEDAGANLQGGMLLDASQRYLLEFNMGVQRIRIKSATGSSTLRVNGMFYIRIEH